MTIGNNLIQDAPLKIALLTFVTDKNDLPFELRKEVLGARSNIMDSLFKGELFSREIDLYIDLLRGHVDLCQWFKDKDWQDTRKIFRGMGSAVHSPDCPMCDIVTRSSAAAFTDNGSVVAPRNTKKRIKLPETLVTWDDLVYTGTSAGWNFKEKLFKPFGRQLRLLHEDATPLHNIGNCSLMYISSLLQDLQNAVYQRQTPFDESSLKGKKVPAPAPLKPEPCGITVAKLALNDEKKSGRYKPVFTTRVSPYVGVAVAKPIRVRKNRGNVRDFWDWRRHVHTGNNGDVAVSLRDEWKGVCGECMVSFFKDRSLTRALLHSGAPDVIIRLDDDYYEDLLEQATDAHKNKTFTIFVVEPVSLGDLRK